MPAMLARAAIRSVGGRCLPTLQRTIPSAIQTRSYAKGQKPNKPYQYKPPNPPRLDRHAQSAQTPPGLGATPAEAAKSSSVSEDTKNMDPTPNAQETLVDSSSTTTGQPSSQQDDVSNRPDLSSEPPSNSESRPLPDLTKGIPSTLESELLAARMADRPNLEIAPRPTSGPRDNLPKSDYISYVERRRDRMAYWFYSIFLASLGAGIVLLGRNWASEEEERLHPEAPSGWGLMLFLNRIRSRLAGTLDYYNEPAFQKLLPDPDPSFERPYTLVLSLKDLLVHSEWDRQNGWRMAKRPGVDYFIRYLSQYYELVIFTSEPSMVAQPIIQKLDPFHIVLWPLFREAARYRNGEYIKDLSFLNRPLNRIIMLDTDASHARNQPENAIILKKWKGDVRDSELISFIPFLEYVASMDFDDVRPVLKSFGGEHIPSEYARREALARKKFEAQLAEEKSKGPKRSIGGLGSLLGVKSPSGGLEGTEPSLSEGFAKGKMYQDLVRERGQKQYEMMDKEIRENGEKWLKEMAEEEKKMNDEAMKGWKNSIFGALSLGRSDEKPSSSS